MNRSQAYDDEVHSIADLEEKANLNMAPMVRDFFAGGSMDLNTMRDNQSAFDRFYLRPRVLRNVTTIDPSTFALGARSSFPLGFSPAANHGMAHPDAEVGTSRAAAKCGVHMVLSTWSNKPLEEVAEQGRRVGNAYAQQLSVVKDPKMNLAIIRRAEAAGYKALFISVDCPWLGRRLNEFRNKFTLPHDLEFPNLPGIEPHNMESTDPRIAYETSLVWENIRYFKQSTKMQIWLKGILTGEDAALAVEAGADGIVVSNHGGRQLDGTPATLDALPGVVAAVQGRIPVHIDGGIRRGSDIFKALALGADYCWVGRIPLWGLSYKGSEGVSLALSVLFDEFKLVMALMGCRNVQEITAEHLAVRGSDGLLRKLSLLPWKEAPVREEEPKKSQPVQYSFDAKQIRCRL